MTTPLYHFAHLASSTIYLTGNYIGRRYLLNISCYILKYCVDQQPPDAFGGEDDYDSDEDAYNLEDVSSDVEVEADDSQ